MSEEIGKHKGAVETLLHEKKELSRLLQIVNSQLQRHLSALEDSGVDTEEFMQQLQEGQQQKRGQKKKGQSQQQDRGTQNRDRSRGNNRSSRRNRSRQGRGQSSNSSEDDDDEVDLGDQLEPGR